jgi:hypothetical protein
VKGHAGDRKHRLTVQLRVVEPVQQMYSAGTGCRDADPEASGELRVAARHERRRFFVPHLHEADLVALLPQRFHDAVDAVAGETEDRVDAPLVQDVDEDLSCRLSHGVPPSSSNGGVHTAIHGAKSGLKAPPLQRGRDSRLHHVHADHKVRAHHHDCTDEATRDIAPQAHAGMHRHAERYCTDKKHE